MTIRKKQNTVIVRNLAIKHKRYDKRKRTCVPVSLRLCSNFFYEKVKLGHIDSQLVEVFSLRSLLFVIRTSNS